MAIARPILTLVSMLVLAGGIAMTFFVVLSGVNSLGTPINQVYFLEASTGGVTSNSPNYHNPDRWTYLSICGVENGNNANCGHTKAAQTFDPPRNFGTEMGLPTQFIGTKKFYWLSRFTWAFYIVALFFAVVAFFLSVFALCTRLGAYLSGFFTLLALFFQTLTASLMTAWTVIARNAFRSNGQTAHLGKYAYGFTWAAMACYLVCTILLCVGGRIGKTESTGTYKKQSYFGRKRSTRSRGSFIDNESQRRVKDEYE